VEVDAVRRFLVFLVVLCGALPVLGAPSEERAISTETTAAGEVVTRSGLKYLDMKPGTGAMARYGDAVDVHYNLWTQDGKKVDSSVDRRQPFTFKLGSGAVIKGFDEGITGMKVGGKRKLIVPANLGYGARGAGDAIPPNAVLIFEVELLRVK
jgi:FKBP-type peptidyl-prolyl cis-trans isomerase